MKKQLLTLAWITILSIRAFGIDANFNHGVFYEPEYGAYVETYMLFYGSSFVFEEKEAGSFQSNAELTYIFMQGDKIIDFSKNIISGPMVKDTLNEVQDFVDQQRFVLAPGNYDLKIVLRDANNVLDSTSLVQKVEVNVPANQAFFSNIILASSAEATKEQNIYSRAGYDLIPKVGSFFGPQDSTLTCYTELYQTDQELGAEEPFLVSFDIVNLETNEEVALYHAKERQSGKDLIPLLKRFDISELMNGAYLIRFEARNKKNELVTSNSLIIQRLNDFLPPDSLSEDALSKTFVRKFTDLDSLKLMTYCLRPESETLEERYIDERLDSSSLEDLQRFFYGFWYDRNPVSPEAEWLKYYEDVKKVDEEFTTSYRHGCATDQGRVYLEYGKPDGRIARPNTSLFLPYEVWHYYATPRKANAKFVFYDTTLGTGASYELLHSNILGEPADYNWFYRLQQRTGQPNTTDEVGAFDTYGVNPREDWAIPP